MSRNAKSSSSRVVAKAAIDARRAAHSDVGEQPYSADEAMACGQQIEPSLLNAYEKFSKHLGPMKDVVRKQSALQGIVLPYPRMLEAMWHFENVMRLGMETKGQPQIGLRIFVKTGCGKTTAAKQYRLLKNNEAKPGTHPVLHVSLSSKGTARQLYVSIMAAIGDGFATAGNETTLRLRVMKTLERNEVRLLVLDEAHHAGRSGYSSEITAEIKLMLDSGVVPIVLLGTDEAVPVIGRDRELAGRLMAPCRLDPLDWTVEDDRELWTDFLRALDLEMKRRRINSKLVGLDSVEVAETLNVVCEGVIGRVMRIMLTAIPLAAQDGRDSIDLEDVAVAVDRWAIEQGFANENPLWDLFT